MSSDDPKTTRLLQTREGITRVPRSQEGVPLKEYFRNTELPRDLDRAVVYATEKGPVLSAPDPVPFGPEHDRKAQDYAEKIKTLIDERGFYSGALKTYAERLARETGQSQDQMKTLIASKFADSNGQEPYDYLQETRERKGLPVTERSRPDRSGPEFG